jgi:hypothetical protein
MASRAQNERKFKYWEELPNGGRNTFANSLAAPVGSLATTRIFPL